MKTIDITFDLETLGNGPQAPIIQIAAIAFDEQGMQLEIPFKLDTRPDLRKYQCDFSTVAWWTAQSEEGRASVFGALEEQRVPLGKALSAFGSWVRMIKGAPAQLYTIRAWCHATFDFPILENACRVEGIDNPLHFRDIRDIRTLLDFSGDQDVEGPEIPHDALCDCEYQGRYISKAVKKLKA